MEASLTQFYSSHQVLVMKISVAIALIRRKPSHKSTRQFVEELAHKHRESEETWKSQAGKLQAEVLRLRQQHHFTSSRLVAECHKALDSAPMASGAGVQESAETCAGLSDETRRRTEDSRSAGAMQPMCTASLPATGHETALRQHCSFLRALQEAQTLSSETFDGLVSNAHGDLLSTVRVTFLHVARDLSIAMDDCASNVAIPEQQMKCAIQSLIGCFSMSREQHMQEMVANELWKLLQVTVKRLLSNNSSFIVRDEQQKLLVWCVSQLGIQLPPLTLDTCFLLTECVCKQASTLSEQVGDFLNVDYEQFDRVFYCFKSLEEILVSTGAMLPETASVSMSKELDKSLLGLADHFPQFAHYAWRLEALLTPGGVQLQSGDNEG